MDRYKNVSGVDRIFDGRLVIAGAVIEVPDDDDRDFNQPAIWQPVKASKAADSNTPQEG